MTTWLNVAEKPSVAKAITQSLAGGAARTIASESPFNPVHEFSFEGKTMLVTSVAGHLMESEFPANTRNWQSYPMHELFVAPITKSVTATLHRVQRNLEKLARRAQTLVLWLDCDREGENICFEVMQIAQRANPRLGVKRAHFSTLTERDLLRAVHTLKEPDRRLSDAVEARQELDLRIGAVFTRFQTVKFRDLVGVRRATSHEGGSGRQSSHTLSFGSCQFPTLGFVVSRHWEQQGFVPEELYTLRLQHGGTRFRSVRGAMHDQTAATLLYEDVLQAVTSSTSASHTTSSDTPHRTTTMNSNSSESSGDSGGGGGLAVVRRVDQRPSRRRPPVPLATVALQKFASAHLRLPAQRCMDLAEELYRDGLISYPRTETDSYNFSAEELLRLVRVQTANPLVAEFAAAMVANERERFRTPLRGGHDDKAHPPIHPLKASSSSSLSSDKERLFELIVRHFLACLSPDAVAATIAVEVSYGEELFTTSGSTVVERGWLAVFPYARWSENCIPHYQVGQRFAPTEFTLERTTTAAPPPLKEDELITLMDRNGIGTDATIAQHIKTIIDRDYVARVNMSLVPTALGVALASAYEMLGLSCLWQPHLRAQMELAMRDIADGRATREQVVAAGVRQYREIFEMLASRTQAFRDELARHLQKTEEENTTTDSTGNRLGSASPSAEAWTMRTAGLLPCGRCGNAAMDLVERPASAEGGAGERLTYRAVRCRACRCQLRLPPGRANTVLTISAPPQRCVLCGFVALRVTNTEKGTSYHVCPYCFSNPPRSNGTSCGSGVLDMETVNEFRCFQCTADCPLASGWEGVALARCRVCGRNDLRLRTNAAMGTFIGCKGYPACHASILLPRAASVRPCCAQRCEHCQAVKLTFDFTGLQGVPLMDRVETVCVFCEPRLQEYLTFREGGSGGALSSSATNSFAAASSVASAASSSAAAAAEYTLPSVHAARRAAAGVRCQCNQPAKVRVSGTAKSRGRAFYSCATNTCKFFAWADEGPTGAAL